MSDLAVVAEGLGKAYRGYARPADRLREVVFRRPRHRLFHALADVSFELPRGEGLGIIGENGAGKSTLLKILAGITAPSSGRARVNGKVASILELGSGFHPELTGRQNIVLNAAMLGLSEREVRARTPEIIAFSELGEFIEQPVKCYSTGMVVRLGFSIATQVDPDILIVDEALSVGDGYFQKKCMDRLLQFIASGRTLLFCSHAMYYVSAFCRRAVWLRQGRVASAGRTDEVVREYEAFLQGKGRAAALAEEERGQEPTFGPARISAVRLIGGRDEDRGDGGGRARVFRHGEPLAVEVEWTSQQSHLRFHLGVGISRSDEVEVAIFASHQDGLAPWSGSRSYRAGVRVPELPLLKGEFTIYVFLLDENALHIHDRRVLRAVFRVEGDGYRFGLIAAAHDWQRADEPAQPVLVAAATAGAAHGGSGA